MNPCKSQLAKTKNVIFPNFSKFLCKQIVIVPRIPFLSKLIVQDIIQTIFKNKNIMESEEDFGKRREERAQRVYETNRAYRPKGSESLKSKTEVAAKDSKKRPFSRTRSTCSDGGCTSSKQFRSVSREQRDDVNSDDSDKDTEFNGGNYVDQTTWTKEDGEEEDNNDSEKVAETKKKGCCAGCNVS